MPAKKKALVVWGGWNGHTPKACADVFAPWLESVGYKVTVSDTLDSYLNKRLMGSLSLIVPIWTMGQISGEQAASLFATVKGGVGLAGWHGGMCDSFRNDVEYQFMTGGQWVAHPGGCIPSCKINITTKKDKITRGIKDFTIKNTEQYYMHVDPHVEVLATTTFSGKHQGVHWIKGAKVPAVWKKRYGKARVFFSSFGHTDKDFETPEALEIVKRGMLWASL
jgi:type 1 glutamine amidotransferase